MKADPILRRPFHYRYFRATLALIIINFIVYFFTSKQPSLTVIFGLQPALFISNKMYWQLITYMFVHGNFQHILFNMLDLLFFGFTVERAIGSSEFLLFYLLCGIVSGACSLGVFLITGMYGAILIGASGAIYAVLFLFATIYPRSKIYIWGILPIPSPLMVVIYVIIEAASQIYGYNTGVAHYTHLFGFAAAWLYIAIRMGINPIRIWINAYKK